MSGLRKVFLKFRGLGVAAATGKECPTPVAKDFNLNRGAPSLGGGGGGAGVSGGGGLGGETDVATRGRGSAPRLDRDVPAKGGQVVPDASPELAPDALKETLHFVDYVVRGQGDGGFTTLLKRSLTPSESGPGEWQLASRCSVPRRRE